MNYLAHLHIAEQTQTSYIGNLLGDFVKGGVHLLPYDEDIKLGIRLHRAVDVYTDQHAFVQQLKATLGPHRRYGGIVLDVLFDHQLALNFDQHSTLSLTAFSKQAYRRLALDNHSAKDIEFPERFCRVVAGMTAADWLSGYREENNIKRALYGISQRIKRPVDLTQMMPWYRDNKAQITQGFAEFYPDLVAFAKQKRQQV